VHVRVHREFPKFVIAAVDDGAELALRQQQVRQ